MEKITLILLMTILILGFIISCDDVPLPNNGGVQTFDYTPEFYSDLDHYLKDLNDNYRYFPKTGTYDENEFRKSTGYIANSIYPEIGTFWGISSIDNLGYGLAEFKSDEKVRIRMGSSSYIEEMAFTSYSNPKITAKVEPYSTSYFSSWVSGGNSLQTLQDPAMTESLFLQP